MDDRIKIEELRDIFGESVPMEAILLLTDDGNKSIEPRNMRAELIEIAKKMKNRVKVGGTYMHMKTTGMYEVMGLARIQTAKPLKDMDDVVIYQSLGDGEFWVRPTDEFLDRFKSMD
jgi:hypothetical protein